MHNYIPCPKLASGFSICRRYNVPKIHCKATRNIAIIPVLMKIATSLIVTKSTPSYLKSAAFAAIIYKAIAHI